PESGKKPTAPVKTNDSAKASAKTEKPKQDKDKSAAEQTQDAANENKPDESQGTDSQGTASSENQEQTKPPEEVAARSGKGITAVGDSV
ncbi:hypothetical protein SB767_31735, partial [Bacillus sp. SIMBA_069]